ncbi:MAG: tripartite tricarboxylate transporter TctB family protein [Hydrogenophaga sp.]
MKQTTADFLLGGICLVVGATYYSVASTIPKSMLSDEIGPGGVPAAVGLAAMVVSVLIMLKAMVVWNQERLAAKLVSSVATDEAEETGGSHWLSVSLVMVLVSLILVLPILGYIISIFLLIMVSAALSGHAKNLKLLVFSLVSSVTLYVIFQVIMSVKLPKGPLGF